MVSKAVSVFKRYAGSDTSRVDGAPTETLSCRKVLIKLKGKRGLRSRLGKEGKTQRDLGHQ